MINIGGGMEELQEAMKPPENLDEVEVQRLMKKQRQEAMMREQMEKMGGQMPCMMGGEDDLASALMGASNGTTY